MVFYTFLEAIRDDLPYILVFEIISKNKDHLKARNALNKANSRRIPDVRAIPFQARKSEISPLQIVYRNITFLFDFCFTAEVIMKLMKVAKTEISVWPL